MKFHPVKKMETHRNWEKVLREHAPKSTTVNKAGHWIHQNLGPKFKPEALVRSAGKLYAPKPKRESRSGGGRMSS
jgi:hypothetical protein